LQQNHNRYNQRIYELRQFLVLDPNGGKNGRESFLKLFTKDMLLTEEGKRYERLEAAIMRELGMQMNERLSPDKLLLELQRTTKEISDRFINVRQPLLDLQKTITDFKSSNDIRIGFLTRLKTEIDQDKNDSNDIAMDRHSEEYFSMFYQHRLEWIHLVNSLSMQLKKILTHLPVKDREEPPYSQERLEKIALHYENGAVGLIDKQQQQEEEKEEQEQEKEEDVPKSPGFIAQDIDGTENLAAELITKCLEKMLERKIVLEENDDKTKRILDYLKSRRELRTYDSTEIIRLQRKITESKEIAKEVEFINPFPALDRQFSRNDFVRIFTFVEGLEEFIKTKAKDAENNYNILYDKVMAFNQNLVINKKALNQARQKIEGRDYAVNAEEIVILDSWVTYLKYLRDIHSFEGVDDWIKFFEEESEKRKRRTFQPASKDKKETENLNVMKPKQSTGSLDLRQDEYEDLEVQGFLKQSLLKAYVKSARIEYAYMPDEKKKQIDNAPGGYKEWLKQSVRNSVFRVNPRFGLGYEEIDMFAYGASLPSNSDTTTTTTSLPPRPTATAVNEISPSEAVFKQELATLSIKELREKEDQWFREQQMIAQQQQMMFSLDSGVPFIEPANPLFK
jgi:hypothetical protein